MNAQSKQIKEPTLTIDIDRIILTGLEIEPEQMERIKGLVEAQLQCLLMFNGFMDGLESGEVRYMEAPTIHVEEPSSESGIAYSLAEKIVGALRSMQGV